MNYMIVWLVEPEPKMEIYLALDGNRGVFDCNAENATLFADQVSAVNMLAWLRKEGVISDELSVSVQPTEWIGRR